MSLGFYLILNLQWYSYKIERVFLHHKKRSWHVMFLLIPIIAYYFSGDYVIIYLVFAYYPGLYFWYKKIDKKLVYTGRVKRYFTYLVLLTLLGEWYSYQSGAILNLIVPIIGAFAFSHLTEAILRHFYYQQAKNKLADNKNLKIVAITASFGKTSIKHFLHALLKEDKNTYMSPGSVNTEVGLMADINQRLPKDCEIYIAEAGARREEDILKIARLLEHQYAIIGCVGKQHIEYFKTLENIKRTKRELLASLRLEKAFVHETAYVDAEKITSFGENGDIIIQNIKADLEGTSWDIITPDKTYSLHTPLLGSFNATNITAAFLMASELGSDPERLVRKVKQLQPVAHRLERIDAGGKVIVDDSFNGNIEGMLEAVRLTSTYEGRKVIVTPGIVESDEKSNITFAKAINETFDIAIISSDVNLDTLSAHIDQGRRKRVYGKEAMTKMLEIETRVGDLILFANDAPNFL
jgi:UDP-N-acetylmuramoyl-tripeptide--D-alanyl-D-alanine ligase